MQNVALCCEICVHVCCRTSFQLAALRFSFATPDSFAAPLMYERDTRDEPAANGAGTSSLIVVVVVRPFCSLRRRHDRHSELVLDLLVELLFKSQHASVAHVLPRAALRPEVVAHRAGERRRPPDLAIRHLLVDHPRGSHTVERGQWRESTRATGLRRAECNRQHARLDRHIDVDATSVGSGHSVTVNGVVETIQHLVALAVKRNRVASQLGVAERRECECKLPAPSDAARHSHEPERRQPIGTPSSRQQQASPTTQTSDASWQKAARGAHAACTTTQQRRDRWNATREPNGTAETTDDSLWKAKGRLDARGERRGEKRNSNLSSPGSFDFLSF